MQTAIAYNFRPAFDAYFAAKDSAADFSEYDADRIEFRKTTPAEAQAIAEAIRADRRKVAKRIETERKVIRHATRALIAAGFHVGVYDGEAVSCKPTQRVTTVMAAVGACDEEWLRVYTPSETEAGKFKRIGTIYLVYGNSGWDVMADYSLNLDDVLKGTNDYADALDLGG